MEGRANTLKQATATVEGRDSKQGRKCQLADVDNVNNAMQ